MKEKLVRTFFSIPVPEQVRSVKNMLYSSMKDNNGEVKWVRDYQLHITLSFLGHTPTDAIKMIKTVTKDGITIHFDGIQVLSSVNRNLVNSLVKSFGMEFKRALVL